MIKKGTAVLLVVLVAISAITAFAAPEDMKRPRSIIVAPITLEI